MSPPSSPTVATVAPLWRRLLSWLIDFAVLAALMAGFLAEGAMVVRHGPASRQEGLDFVAETLLAYSRLWIPSLLLFAFLVFSYSALFTALGGQTPGKRALQLAIIDKAGQPPSPAKSLLRAVFSLASGALMLMGFWLVLVDRRHQALHDKLVGTFVVQRG